MAASAGTLARARDSAEQRLPHRRQLRTLKYVSLPAVAAVLLVWFSVALLLLRSEVGFAVYVSENGAHTAGGLLLGAIAACVAAFVAFDKGFDLGARAALAASVAFALAIPGIIPLTLGPGTALFTTIAVAAAIVAGYGLAYLLAPPAPVFAPGTLVGTAGATASAAAANPAPATNEAAAVDVRAFLSPVEPREVYGRDMEIDRILKALCRKGKSSPVIIGEAGVGKTAIVEGLAWKLAQGEAPADLGNRRLLALDTSALMGGTRWQGELELRVNALMKAAADPNVILFVDELHQLGSSGTQTSVAEQMKPALSRGELKLIGATTPHEYRALERDPALARRFDPIRISPPDSEQTLAILRGRSPEIAADYDVVISGALLREIVELTEQFLPTLNQPDKSLDVLEKAAVEAAGGEISRGQIETAVAEKAGVPIGAVSSDGGAVELALEQELGELVFGQPDAVAAVARALRRSKAGIGDPNRPRGSFLAYGPPGVGKTELAEATAEVLLGDRSRCLSLDMSEFQEEHSVSKLLGSPPGYVGHDEGGRLTEAVRKQPFTVIVFDEIEKAHPKILDLLLQILEKGRLTDSHGDKVDFRQAIVFATTNLSADQFAFMLRPEILDRFDEKLAFAELDDETRMRLLLRQIEQRAERYERRKGLQLEVSDAAVERLLAEAERGSARELRRAVDRIDDMVAELVLAGAIARGDRVLVAVAESGEIAVAADSAT